MFVTTIVGDPTVAGATLTVFADGTTASSQTFTLPAALWTATKTGVKSVAAAPARRADAARPVRFDPVEDVPVRDGTLVP
jgi:hypothetical protein